MNIKIGKGNSGQISIGDNNFQSTEIIPDDTQASASSIEQDIQENGGINLGKVGNIESITVNNFPSKLG
jgi:hypothetical protein